MSTEQPWDTTLNPDARRLLRVELGAVDMAATDASIRQLMGRTEAGARRESMELRWDAIEVDIRNEPSS